MTIEEAVHEAFMCACAKGFHDKRTMDGRDDTLVRLCLVHTEVSEAAQEVKRHWAGKPTPEQLAVFGDELADILIRVFDIAGCTNVNLEEAVKAKMEKNRGREFRYGTPQGGQGL